MVVQILEKTNPEVRLFEHRFHRVEELFAYCLHFGIRGAFGRKGLDHGTGQVYRLVCGVRIGGELYVERAHQRIDFRRARIGGSGVGDPITAEEIQNMVNKALENYKDDVDAKISTLDANLCNLDVKVEKKLTEVDNNMNAGFASILESIQLLGNGTPAVPTKKEPNKTDNNNNNNNYQTNTEKVIQSTEDRREVDTEQRLLTNQQQPTILPTTTVVPVGGNIVVAKEDTWIDNKDLYKKYHISNRN